MKKRRLPKYLNKKLSDKRSSSGRIEYQLKKINYDFQDFQAQFSDARKSKGNNLLIKLLKYFGTLLVSILLIGRVSFQVNTIFSNSTSALDYEISQLKVKPPITNGETRVEFSTSTNEQNDIKYNYNYQLISNIAVTSGNIQDAYLVYSDNDDNRISSLKEFQPLKLNKNPFSSLIFPLALVPYSTNFFDLPLSKYKISTNIFYSSAKKKIYKPLYIMTVDSHNNIDVQVLLINSEGAAVSNINLKSPSFVLDLNKVIEKPKYKLVKPADLLGKSFEKSSYLSREEFESSIQYITKVAKKYYIR